MIFSACILQVGEGSIGPPLHSTVTTISVPDHHAITNIRPRAQVPRSWMCRARQLTSAVGSNLSQGQRQLVSLARAMLTPSNILVLDEATAAVDVETDAALQNTLRSPLFAHRTIITVAHRINTIMDSDRIVVLDKGEVVEFDTPAELIKRKGIFYGLVKQSGLDTE